MSVGSSRHRAQNLRHTPVRPPRVVLYSHDTMGLGHMRRNLLIAQALAQSDLRATSLMITGAHETNFFSLPRRVDCLTLPRICKDQRGNYTSAKLDVSLQALTQIRQESIGAALEQFEPDVLIVDKVPVGAEGELLPALRSLAKRGRTRCILGLRDILDESSTVKSEWLSKQNIQAIEDFYDAIWIYGDPHIYNAVREYRFPKSLSKMTRFTGYLDQSSRIAKDFDDIRLESNSFSPLEGKYVVCTVGGGQDGAELVETFIEAVTPDIHAIVLTGPYLPISVMHDAVRVAAVRKNVQIIGFTAEADYYIAGADRVVSMAGYNTVCSILSFGIPALLIPRLVPRREQWIRAQRLRNLGVIDVLSPEHLTSKRLADWIRHPLEASTKVRNFVDLNGLDRIVEWVGSLLSGDSAASKLLHLSERNPSVEN